MKKVIVLIAFVASVFAGEVGEYVPLIITDNPINNDYVNMVERDAFKGDKGDAGIDGIDGESIIGETGATGLAGVDGVTSFVLVGQSLASKLQAVQGATSSVELNPDHEGLSVGIGYSKSGGYHAGGIGIMYAWDISETTSVGWNVKAYKAQGSGVKGISTGVTVGF